MKCNICGGVLTFPSYRQVFNYVNIPAHGKEDWEQCEDRLKKSNMKTLYTKMKPIFDLLDVGEYQDVLQLLEEPNNQLELLLNIDRIKEMIDSLLPEIEVTLQTSVDYVPVEAKLDTINFRRLVAHELNYDRSAPTFLKHTTLEILHKYQTGEMPINSRHYFNAIPESKSIRTIYVPAQLVESMQEGWVFPKRSIDRVLLTFLDGIEVDFDKEETAYQILKGNASPMRIYRTLKNTPKSQVVNYIDHDDLQKIKDKRKVIHEQMIKADFSKAIHLASQLSGKTNSTRISWSDYQQLKNVSHKNNVPLYKLVTALLILANKGNP